MVIATTVISTTFFHVLIAVLMFSLGMNAILFTVLILSRLEIGTVEQEQEDQRCPPGHTPDLPAMEGSAGRSATKHA
jgi:hypothetical protein